MKLLLLIPNNVAGGAERVMISLANKFSDMEIETFLMTFDSSSNFYFVNSKVNLLRLNVGTEKIPKLIKYIFLPFIEIKRYIRMKKKMREIKADCVISFMFMTNIIGSLCCKKLNIPIIISERNDPTKYSKLKRIIMKYTYSKSNGFVCQSTKIKKMSEEDYKLKNVVVIPNPISENQVSDYNLEKENKIISVGRLIPQKNHQQLINVFAKLANKYPDYKLYIYGDGPLKKQIEKQISDLKLEDKVFLPGVEKEVIKNNRDAKLFVLTSKYEGYPNVLVEAMSNGIISISSDFPSGSASDIIENGKNGFLFKVSDDEELLKRIDYCLNNYENIKTIENEGKKIYFKTKIDNVAKMWVDYIKNII